MTYSKKLTTHPLKRKTHDRLISHIGSELANKQQPPTKEHLIEMANFLYARYKNQKALE